MPDEKLCPYRPVTEEETFISVRKKVTNVVGFAPCLRERCAMWREKVYLGVHMSAMINGKRAGVDTPGRTVVYCGLAGEP